MTAVAYVVVTWNNREIIDECLRSLVIQAEAPPEIYVIDNASTDGTADFIADTFPTVRLTRSTENTGFSRGNNMMIAKALHNPVVDYVALVNSDAVLHRNWTSEVVAHIACLPNVAAAQGRTIDYHDHMVMDSEYVYVGRNLQCVQAGFGEPVATASHSLRKVFGVNAAAAMYSREFIESCADGRLFDERFYMYLEDVDVAFRAFMAGWDSYSVPSAAAYHMGSASARKRPNSYATYMCFRNQSAVIVKSMPLSVLLRFLPRATVSELRLYTRRCRTDGFRVALAAVRGRLVGIVRSPLYLRSRRNAAELATMPPRRLIETMRSCGVVTVDQLPEGNQ